MNRQRTFRSRLLAALAAVVATTCTACGGSRDGQAAAAGGAPPAPSPTASVVYEPAYPAEVSGEGLTQQDVTQQEAPHSHDGGEPHAHDEETREEGDNHGHPH